MLLKVSDSQSEASMLITWPLLTNQSPVLLYKYFFRWMTLTATVMSTNSRKCQIAIRMDLRPLQNRLVGIMGGHWGGGAVRGGQWGLGVFILDNEAGAGRIEGGALRVGDIGHWIMRGGGVLRRGALRVGDVHTCSEETLILATNLIQYIIQYLAGIREGIYPIRPWTKRSWAISLTMTYALSIFKGVHQTVFANETCSNYVTADYCNLCRLLHLKYCHLMSIYII